MRCGKPIEDDTGEYCHDCMLRDFFYTRGAAAFSYTDGMKRSMYAFKYNNRREYGKFYSKIIYNNYCDMIKSWNADVLIPVPLHPKRYRKRGYNQAQVLAEDIGRKFNIPVDTKILIRSKNTIPLKELSDKERKVHIENAFQVVCDITKYKKAILVDDIYTTGATVNECASVLKESGMEKIYFITACIGNGF